MVGVAAERHPFARASADHTTVAYRSGRCIDPVHITPGYELSLEVNRFQSQWLYLQKYKKDVQGQPNKYKITESEKYAQDKKNKELLDFKYQEAGKQTNTKWQFTVITPVHEHQKAMIELGSESRYKKEAKECVFGPFIVCAGLPRTTKLEATENATA